MSHQNPVSGSVKLFSDQYVLSKAGSSFIRAVFREERTGTTLAAEDRRKKEKRLVT